MTTTSPDPVAPPPADESPAAPEATPTEPARYERPANCPTCGSLDPAKHPATAVEGELRLCTDPWHAPYARVVRVQRPADPVAPSPLVHEQAVRAAACDRARQAIGARHPFGTNAVDALDVVNVAQFIIDGRDPWGTTETRAVEAWADGDPIAAWLDAKISELEAEQREAHARVTGEPFASNRIRAEADRQSVTESLMAFRTVRAARAVEQTEGSTTNDAREGASAPSEPTP